MTTHNSIEGFLSKSVHEFAKTDGDCALESLTDCPLTDQPEIVLDCDGRVILWYLPGIFSTHFQVCPIQSQL